MVAPSPDLVRFLPLKQLIVPTRLFTEGKKDSGKYADKTDQVVPAQGFFQVEHGKHGKHKQGNDFLCNLKLKAAHSIQEPMPVCRHHQAIFKKGNSPAHHDRLPQRNATILEESIPGHGHEDIRGQ